MTHHVKPLSPRLKDDPTFLELSYAELEKRNLEIKSKALRGENLQSELMEALKKEEGIKAVTVCFSDMEGKLHMLDYNKAFLLNSADNLTFDGSSIRGFTPQHQSDLRLALDWGSFRWLPADVFGHGKGLIFARISDKDGSPYKSDYRSILMDYASKLKSDHGYTINLAPEIEGFIMEGVNAEQNFDERCGFELASKGGYFNVLPQDRLREFIDLLAEATRALGFENEKDHPEVAPSQFEMNYKYTEIITACDQIQIYKVVARQIAKNMGLTASFLPKPVVGINGSGMHSNISLAKNGENAFYSESGKLNLSDTAHDFATGILYRGNDLCLAINSSVNAYRRLDPAFEAPNEIKMSSTDRGSMIRIPIGNKNSARIEVRTVAPDANPYLAYYLVLRAGMDGVTADSSKKQEQYALYDRPVKKLPGNISDAIEAFAKSDFIKDAMTAENMEKYLNLKKAAAGRSPRELGTRVKSGEVWYHHEVTNQVLWNQF